MFNCKYKNNCPHLNNCSTDEVLVENLLAENEYWKKRVEHMQRIMNLAEQKILKLEQENKVLKDENNNLQEELNHAIRKPFKPNIKKEETTDCKKETKKKGAPVGHRGGTRPRPTKIDNYIKVTHEKCQYCNSNQVTNYENFKEHIIEDIEIKVNVTCWQMHYGYCRDCKKVLYPKIDGLIPDSHIGPVARAVGEYFRYISVPYLKVEKIFTDIFGLEITYPSFIKYDKNIAKNGETAYEQIKQLIRNSKSIHADETGWRVNGINKWLWNFTNKEFTFYRIEKSRGSEIVEDTLGTKYNGTLISDFYSAYNPIKAQAKQKCLAHLLNEIKTIEDKKLISEGSNDQILFQQLKSILKEAIEIWNKYKTGEKTIDELKAFKEIVAQQLTEFVKCDSENDDIKRIQKRIIKYNQELLTFLDNPEIEPTNNRAERQLRPNVIMRKITFGNRSDIGAKNHSIVMSLLQTGISNGIKPLDILLLLTTKTVVNLSEIIEPKTKLSESLSSCTLNSNIYDFEAIGQKTRAP